MARSSSNKRAKRKQKRARRREQRRSGQARGCTCPDDGGFAEALPMPVWLDLLKQRAKCPIHGERSGE